MAIKPLSLGSGIPLWVAAAAALTLAQMATQAQTTTAGGPQKTPFGTVSASLAPASVKPGGKATLTVTVTLEPGFHIYANKPGATDVIPTNLTVAAPPAASGVRVGAPVYPAAKSETIAGISGKVNVYDGDKVVFKVPVTVAKTAKGKIPLNASIRMQGCNASMCYPPKTYKLPTNLTVSGG